jgi:hypothetical protein
MRARFIGFAVVLMCAKVAFAAEFLVYQLEDSGPGSLRQALLDHEQLGGENTIVFSNSVAGIISLTNGELVVNGNVHILGPGPNVLTLAGNNSNRVFRVTGGDATISGFSIIGGNASGQPGGGLHNSGTLVLTNSRVTGGYASQGGAAWNSGNLRIYACTMDGNVSTAEGSALFNTTNASLSVSNTTVALNGSETNGTGVAIFNLGVLHLHNSTIASNIVTGTNCAVFNGWTTFICSAIVAGNGSDTSGEFISGRFNIIGNGDGSFGWHPGDMIGNGGAQFDAGLEAFGDYGGPLPTMALRSNSVAIDKGRPGTLVTDNRGFQRTIDIPEIPNGDMSDGTDIGAFEFGSSLPTLPLPPFLIADMQLSGSNVVIGFQTILGTNYHVEYKNNFETNEWTALSSNLPGNGDMLWITNEGGALESSRFYRAVIVP